MTEKYVVVEMMLGMLMSITGPFQKLTEAMKQAELENEKLQRSKLKYRRDTLYQIWPLKEKTRVKTTPRKKAKRTSKA